MGTQPARASAGVGLDRTAFFAGRQPEEVDIGEAFWISLEDGMTPTPEDRR